MESIAANAIQHVKHAMSADLDANGTLDAFPNHLGIRTYALRLADEPLGKRSFDSRKADHQMCGKAVPTINRVASECDSDLYGRIVQGNDLPPGQQIDRAVSQT